LRKHPSFPTRRSSDLRTIYHGIDPEKFSVGNKTDRDYFAFLGRTSPEKGLAEICRMIKQTDHKLKIAAKVDYSHIDYFRSQVERSEEHTSELQSREKL